MPDPATEFNRAGLQPGQYWPVEYHPGSMQTLQPVTYGAITGALQEGFKQITESPLNPVVREQRNAQIAAFKTAQAEQGVNQQVLQDIRDHPENYSGLLGYKVGQGAEILPTGNLANNWAAQNAAHGYPYVKPTPPQPPAKTDRDGGGGQQKKTAEQTQGGDTAELAAARAYVQAHGGNPNNVRAVGGGLYSDGGNITIDGQTAIRFAAQNPRTPGQVEAIDQSQTGGGGTNAAQPNANQPQTTTQNYPEDQILNQYGRLPNAKPGAAHATQQGNQYVITDKQGNVIDRVPVGQYGFNAGGLVSPFRPMTMAAPPPAPMFMQGGGMVPGGQAPGAMPQMPPGGAPQAPVGAVPPDQMQRWQNATQGNTASAKAALEWAQNNMDTAINRAVLMRGGGPGGQDAYAFYGKKGGSNIVPVMQMMAHGFAPEIIAQNTTSHLSAAPQPATPPPAAPQGPGPIRMADGGMVPPLQTANANPSADPNATPNATPNPSATPSISLPLTGDKLAKAMNTPGAVADQTPDITNPTVRQFQAQANKPKTPINSLGDAYYHNRPDEVNVTGTDGFLSASNGEINSPLMARYLRTLLDNGELDRLPKADNGDPILKTLGNGTVIRVDRSHNNGLGEPSGAPYISYSGDDPYHDVRLYAGMDHPVLHQNTDQELAQSVHNITGLPADAIAQMSRTARLDLLYAKYRKENLPNLPEDVERQLQDSHFMLQQGGRIQDLLANMAPGEYNIGAQRWNEFKNVAGNPLAGAWNWITHPFGLGEPTGGEQPSDLTQIDKNWSQLDQSHQALSSYITSRANLDGSDKEHLLKSLGDPAFTNLDYPGRIKQFMKDQIANYQIAVRKYEAMGYYVPQIYKDDMLSINHTGRVLDPTWGQVTPTSKAAQSKTHELPAPTPTEGTFPSGVTFSRTAPAGEGTKDKPYNLDKLPEDQKRYFYSYGAKGTYITVNGKTFPLQ